METKVALFGGSFNPIHNGHINTIKQVLDLELVDEVWILPCRNHAFNKNMLSGEKRVEMIELAIEGIDNVKISSEELNFNGKSYTYDTIMRLKNKFPNYNFYFICGSDILYEFEGWYKYKELSKEIDFIIMEREGFRVKSTGEMNVIFTLNKNVNNVSSTTINNKIKKGEDITNFVHLDVKKYIEKNDLYKN